MTIEAKVGRMRRSERFEVRALDDGKLVVESRRTVGVLDPETRAGVLNVNGEGPQMLVFPPEFVESCLEVAA